MDKNEAMEFLSTLINKINSQDNRCTAMPYFYVIRTERWRICKEGHGAGETRYIRVCWDGGDPEVFDNLEEYTKRYLERHDDELESPTPLDQFELTDPQCVSVFAEELASYNQRLVELKQEAQEKWEALEEFEEEKYYDEDNVFLTEEGYEDHVRLNGHNLGKRGRDYHSYVKHAFRNPEMHQLLQAVAVICGKELGKK